MTGRIPLVDYLVLDDDQPHFGSACGVHILEKSTA
jgi:hypothetical protein